MKLKYISSVCIAATLLFAGCSDGDDWKPGEAAPDNMGVFFTNLDSYDLTVEVDDPHVFSVGLGRIDDSQAASVPLKVISAPEGVVVPASVDFEAGQQSANFNIDITDMPLKTSGDIIVQIDPAFAALYGAGSSQLTMKVTTTGGWELLADDVVISCYLNTSFPNVSATLYVLDGTSRFKIPDFLGSGTDLMFTLSDPTLSYPVIFPFTNYQYYYDLWPDDYADDTDYPWYFYDTEKAAYPAIWTPQGWSKSIEYLSFYVYDGDDKGSYFGINKGYGTMESYIEFADGSGAWEYFEFRFTTKFDPFAQE